MSHYKDDPDRITDPFQRAPTWSEQLADLWPATRAQIRDLWDFVINEATATAIALDTLRRDTMSAVDDLIGRFAAATDEIASDLDALRAEVANLDTSVAAKFEPLVSRLEALGADPTDPIPAPEPEPAPEPGPEPEPTPEG